MLSSQSIFVKCDCCCNVVELEYSLEEFQFYFSIWNNGYTSKPLSKKERIRWCEQVMKTGNPWADHTIINKQDAKRIVKFLTKYINHGKAKSGSKKIHT
jgi:hypothetical protein